MPKPVKTNDLFDLWQKMLNPGAFPMQNLMFPAQDIREVDKRIAELETVEHWLKANLNLLQLSIRSLEYQRALIKGGERVQAALDSNPASEPAPEPANPAQWIWDMMAQAQSAALRPEPPPSPAPKKRRR